MKSAECTLKRIVALSGNKVPLKRGSIVGPVSTHPKLGDVVEVEWDFGGIQKITPRSLITKREADALEEKLYAEEYVKQMASQEQWTEVERQVHDKMLHAAELINEAAALVSENKADNSAITEMYESCAPLMNALHNAGWDTSSLNS